jgi:hypothetical protein
MNPNLPVNSTMVGKDSAPLPVWYRFFSNASKLLVALTQSGTTAQRPTSYLWVGRPYFNTDLVMVEFWDGSTWVTPSGGGGGAPTTATYVTMSLNATLTNERTAAVTSPITLTDGGANNPVTWAFDQTVVLGNNARVAVSKNSGATVGTRRRVNLIEGANVTLTIADDAGNEEVDVTIAAAGGGSVTWTEAEVDFGATPVYDANFTVVDASITALDQVPVLASGKAATDRVDGDDQWDAITYSALPASGSMTVYANANPGPVVGKRKIQYQVA